MLKSLNGTQNNKIWKKVTDILFPVILVCFSLMHVTKGLTVTDTGYNYGNFVFFQSLDDMWKFSTYLANVTGSFFTKLPFGETVLGLNIYTGLTKTLVAVLSYYLCVFVCKLRKEFVFLGSMIALGFSWCPTALLYNYMTYLFFNLAVILIFCAFKTGKNRFFVLAGISLGLNFMVRIPNVAEIALILSVWFGMFLGKKKMKEYLTATLYCILGYVISIGSVITYISIRYGFKAYVDGIQELFAMTENATSYSAFSMVKDSIFMYLTYWKWFACILVIILSGTVMFMIMKKRFEMLKKALMVVVMILYIVVSYIKGYYTLHYRDYYSILFWGVLFLMVALGICFYVIFFTQKEREIKVLSSMVAVLILITPLGSNNSLYSPINNLYVVAPFVCSMIGDLLYSEKRVMIKDKIEISSFPATAVLICFVGMVLVQSVLFGANFVFRDGNDGQERTYEVVGNEILSGIKTTEENAKNLQGLNDYLMAKDIENAKALLFGDVPALAFYFGLEPVLSSTWPDLESFSHEKFSEEMDVLALEDSLPIVITDVITKESLITYPDEEEGNTNREKKLIKLRDFLENNHYKESYSNEAFVVYEIVEEIGRIYFDGYD